jgi:hypothetical protein
MGRLNSLEKRMKKPLNPVIPDYTPRSERKKVEEVKLDLLPCCNCGKKISDGYYGRFGDGGVCSKTCNAIQEAKPKYPEKGGGDADVALPGKQNP